MAESQINGDHPGRPIKGDSMKMTHRNGRLAAIGLATAGVVAGGVLAVSGMASAATNTTTSTGSATTTTSVTAQAQPGPGGATPVRSDEKAVDASQAATLKAAAEKAVPGATVVRAETDAGDATYEVHMQKADGSMVTVKFDANVTKVESGMGQGDPMSGGPNGAPKGAPSGAPSGPPSGAPSGAPTAGGASG